MSKQIRIVVDYENNAGAWWDAGRAQARREIQHVPAAARTFPCRASGCSRIWTQ